MMASMLHSIDKALAGAIDVIADDISAGVKAVKERGVMDALSGAMEEAGNMMHNGASAVIGPGPEAPVAAARAKAGGAAGGSGYADVCSGGGAYSSTGILPYTPSGSMNTGSFAPATGTQSADSGAASSSSSAKASGGAPSTAAAKEPLLEQAEAQARFDVIRKEGTNSKCFDCGAANVDWCSVSFGCLVCIECSGAHRQMGTHISRVRSCRMDSWGEKQLQVFAHGGNARLAQFFEANALPAVLGFQRYKSPAAEWYREAWIKNRFLGLPVPPPPSGIVAGPCSDAPPQQQQHQPAPIVDLMDLDSARGNPTAASATNVGAPVVDLLAFDEPAAGPPVQATPAAAPQVDIFVGFGDAPTTTGADLLDFGLAAPAPAPVAAPAPAPALDLFSFDSAPTPVTQPAAPPLLRQPHAAPVMSPVAALGTSMPGGLPTAGASPPSGFPANGPLASGFSASNTFPQSSFPASDPLAGVSPAAGAFSLNAFPAAGGFPAAGAFPPNGFPADGLPTGGFPAAGAFPPNGLHAAGLPAGGFHTAGTFPPNSLQAGSSPAGGFPAAGAFPLNGFPAGGLPAGGFPATGSFPPNGLQTGGSGVFSPNGFPAVGLPTSAFPVAGAFPPNGLPAGGFPTGSGTSPAPPSGPRTMAEGAMLAPPPPREEKEEDNFLAMAKLQYNM